MVFFNLYFLRTFDELSVVEVIKILPIDLFFSNFSTNGIILNISPTLAPWNHISFFFVKFFSEKKQNFSLNLKKSSFFLLI